MSNENILKDSVTFAVRDQGSDIINEDRKMTMMYAESLLRQHDRYYVV